MTTSTAAPAEALSAAPPKARIFICERGAIDDTAKLRAELASKLGVPFVLIEVNPGLRFEELTE